MTNQEIRDFAEQLRATNAELHELLKRRATVKGFAEDDHILAIINAANPRKKLRAHMITKRAIVSVLGIKAPPFLNALRAFAAGTAPGGGAIPEVKLPDGHTLAEYAAVAAEMIPYLDGTEGLDIGDPLTQSLLAVLGAVAFVDAGDAAKVAALGLVDDPLTLAQMSVALSGG